MYTHTHTLTPPHTTTYMYQCLFILQLFYYTLTVKPDLTHTGLKRALSLLSFCSWPVSTCVSPTEVSSLGLPGSRMDLPTSPSAGTTYPAKGDQFWGTSHQTFRISGHGMCSYVFPFYMHCLLSSFLHLTILLKQINTLA